jgi:hypothetical protein
MEMRIDHPGDDRGAPAVDPLRITAGGARDGGRLADGEDARAVDRERRGDGTPRVTRQDAAVLEEIADGQSDDGSGFASLSFISPSQHWSAPVPGLLHSTSTPHLSQRYRFPSCVGMRLP